MKKQQKKYINLVDDKAFKTFFSQNKKLLLSLLKAFLPLPNKKTVKSVRFIKSKGKSKTPKVKNKGSQNPELALSDSSLYSPDVTEKQVVLDLNVSLNTGEKVDVEMQAVSKKAFVDRVVFYWSRLHTRGFKVGTDYNKLHTTYSLIFTDFSVFGLQKRGVVTSFSIRSDKDPHFVLNNHLRMVFVELSRFKKRDIDKLLDLQDEWCYFLKHSGRMTVKSAKLLAKKGEDMSKALSLLADLSVSDYEELKRQTLEKEYLDKRAIKQLAYEKGMAKGIRDGRAKGRAEGRAKGRAEGHAKGRAEGHAKGIKAGRAEGHAKGHAKGRAEGRAEGREKEKQEVALNMLKEKADLTFISKVTGLSVKKLNKLKNDS